MLAQKTEKNSPPLRLRRRIKRVVFDCLVLGTAVSAIVIIDWAASPASGTRAWHEKTVEATLQAFDQCRGLFPGQEFSDCVKEKAGYWIRVDSYAAVNGVPSHNDLFVDFRRAQAQMKADASGDLGRKATEVCHRMCGGEKSEAFMDCIVDFMYPPSQEAKDQTRFSVRALEPKSNVTWSPSQ